MGRKNYPNIGDEIKDIVQNAVNTMDFHQLNRDISYTVKGALDEVRDSLGVNRSGKQNRNIPYQDNEPWNHQNNQFNQNFQQNSRNNSWNKQESNNQGNWRNNQRQQGFQNNGFRNSQNAGQGFTQNGTNHRGYSQNSNDTRSNSQHGYNRQGYHYNSNNSSWNQKDNRQGHYQWKQGTSNNYMKKRNQEQGKKQNYPFPYVPVGRVSGVLLTVFGSIGLGIFGLGAFVLALAIQMEGLLAVYRTAAFALFPFLIASIFMTMKGRRKRKRLQRFRRYLGILHDRSYYTVKELSANLGVSQKYLLKDFRNMISIGMLPEGHIDEQETCIMLNRESYNQYLELQKNLRMQKTEEQKTGSDNGNVQNKQDSNSNKTNNQAMSKEVKAAIESGRTYIRLIKEANDAIPGEDISRKLYRLEEVIGKIFDYVEIHPEQLTEIQKFMEYYLPTTLKLVNAYKEFDYQSVQGENITTAKNEIEGTLDTINLAFENLLDSLFEDAAMDVSTDISVLQTMLAQEGLTKKDFK